MAQPKAQTSGPVYNYLQKVADEAARLALSPVENDYVLQLDDQQLPNGGGRVIWLYTGGAWVQGGLIPAFAKGVLIIQKATTEFQINCGASKAWVSTTSSQSLHDDSRRLYGDFITAIPTDEDLTNETIRIVAF
jgi:hypothetical protein